MNVRSIAGPVRDLSTRELGLFVKDRHSVSMVQPASNTREGAEKALNEAIQKYQDRTWPGGCVTDRLLVHWTDLDMWSGVFETYYSFS